MGRCEDFPCCGHESGCCPSYDESGNQLNMVCICGAILPITNRYSICDSCLNRGDDDDREEYNHMKDEQKYYKWVSANWKKGGVDLKILLEFISSSTIIKT